MTTIRIDNGDLFVDENRGVLLKINSLEEGSQNVARHILSEYNGFFDEGNELINFTLGSSPSGLTDALVSQFVTEAVNRLIIKQRETELEDQIIKVNQIKTQIVGLSTLVFMIEVLFESGVSISVVDQVALRPAALDHINNPNSFLTV